MFGRRFSEKLFLFFVASQSSSIKHGPLSPLHENVPSSSPPHEGMMEIPKLSLDDAPKARQGEIMAAAAGQENNGEFNCFDCVFTESVIPLNYEVAKINARARKNANLTQVS